MTGVQTCALPIYNKAFGIGFGTFPSDDTGVFHILEHSVLAGSEKYPVTSPFLQLLKSSMASFLNAMTFPDKTVYPFATPNETDFRNLMDVYLNAVFCPLAMVDRAVFEQEGWHRDADGTVSGVVYNEMQGALAAPDAQLQNALERAMFPDTAYGFVSGGDPESIPALTYEKYQRVYRRHYSADNCCITLYGKMDMAEKLEMLDRDYLSRMPRTTTRPRLTVQDEQPGTCVELPYYTENPEPDEVQCALAWYTGAFADRERQLGVEILLDALLGTNNSPLKAALLAEKLGADIDMGFDDSTLQPTLELSMASQNKLSAIKYDKVGEWGWNAIDANYKKILEKTDDQGKKYMDYYNGQAFDFGQYQHGYIGVYDFNISGAVSNNFYLGVTAGLHDVNYRSSSSYFEQLEQNTNGASAERLKIDGTGVDVKVGAIFLDRKSTRLNSSHVALSRMPSSA